MGRAAGAPGTEEEDEEEEEDDDDDDDDEEEEEDEELEEEEESPGGNFLSKPLWSSPCSSNGSPSPSPSSPSPLTSMTSSSTTTSLPLVPAAALNVCTELLAFSITSFGFVRSRSGASAKSSITREATVSDTPRKTSLFSSIVAMASRVPALEPSAFNFRAQY